MDSQLPNGRITNQLSVKSRVFTGFSLFVTLILIVPQSFAGEVDVDAFGFTYHLHRKGAVYNAPLKLDHAGVKVFNPGLGLGYDFRQDRHTEGLSWIIHGGMFENCDNHPFSFAGLGGRYRKYFNKKNYFEANLMGVATYGNSSDDKKYQLSPTPYANIGVGHDYGKYSITYYLSYIPKGAGGSITSSTDMLFLSMEVAF